MENLGLEVAPLDAEGARQLGVSESSGVTSISVRRNGPAADAGWTSAMVIVQVDRQPVETVDRFVTSMGNSRGSNGSLPLVRHRASCCGPTCQVRTATE